MEILNNIWSALNTENEALIRLILIPSSFLEVYIGLLLFSECLKISYTRKQKTIYVLSAGTVGFLSMNIIQAPFNIILNYILLISILRILFKLPYVKIFLAIVIPLTIFTIVGNIILNPIVKIFNIDSFLQDTIPFHRIVYLCILYIIVFLIANILKIRNYKINLLDDLDSKNKKIIYVDISFGIFTLIVQLIITLFYVRILPIYITILSSISLIFYFLINFYSLNRILRLQITTQNLENAENYNKTLSFLYDNVKGFKHDFDDIINMIGGYVRTNDLDGLKKYYLELENDYEKVKNIATLNPNLINNPGIYNLLVAKYKKANDFGVKVHLEYFFDFERIHMPIYQFSRMFGILLDNAIEATKNCDEKEVNISFRDSSSNKTQIIIVENTYSNKEVDTSKIFEKGVSEKKNHMGMGLWEVNQIIMKNNNIHLETTKDDKYFKQQLEIYY